MDHEPRGAVINDPGLKNDFKDFLNREQTAQEAADEHGLSINPDHASPTMPPDLHDQMPDEPLKEE